jgi:Holliday junction resolvase RusA-like endonuclease
VTALTFHLACVPPKTNHHAKRIVRIGQFSRLADKPELVAAKETLESLLLPHQIPEPLTPPYVLSLEFTWPWLVKHKKQERALGRVPMTSRPDASNLAKTLEDRLTVLGFITDDNAVVALHVTKWWGSTPGITVTIAPFTADCIANTEPPTWRADEALPLLKGASL